MGVDHNARVGGTIQIVFSSLSNMKVCCVFSLESPHRRDSNEDTQHNIISIKKNKMHPKKFQIQFNVCSYGIIFVRDFRTSSK